MAKNGNWTHSRVVRVSRMRRRGVIRRHEAFGWNCLEWEDGSETRFDGFENNSYKPKYKTEKWTDISFERNESDFINYKSVTFAEGIYNLFYKLRWITTALVIIGLLALLVVSIAAEAEFAESFFTFYAFLWLFFFLSIVGNIVSYFVGKSTVDKNRK